jgi:hypothetical protein
LRNDNFFLSSCIACVPLLGSCFHILVGSRTKLSFVSYFVQLLEGFFTLSKIRKENKSGGRTIPMRVFGVV